MNITKLSDFCSAFKNVRLINEFPARGIYIFLVDSPNNKSRKLVYRFICDEHYPYIADYDGEDIPGSFVEVGFLEVALNYYCNLSYFAPVDFKDFEERVSYNFLCGEVEDKNAVVFDLEGNEIDINNLRNYEHFQVNGDYCHFEDDYIVIDKETVMYELTPYLKEKFNIEDNK